MACGDVFDTNNILSITMIRKIVCNTIILIISQCAGMKDACVFAQTVEVEQGILQDEMSNHPQAESGEGLPPAERPAKQEPEIIRETVGTPVESWGSAKGFGEKIDWIHASLFRIAQDQVERVDNWFKLKLPPDKQRVMEPSRFRIGVFSEVKIIKGDRFDVKPVVDFDTDIEIPNVRQRLKIIITTSDPTTLPGRDVIEQQDKSLRTAVTGQWRSDVSSSIGVRLRWKPQLFANAVWSPTWKKGNWLLYPHQKFFWENENGFGEISTLVADHWINRWNTRFSTSIKWSEQDKDNDLETGRKDEGFRWSEIFIFDHANELLDETQLGRRVSGDDVVRGWGLRLGAFGGFHVVDEYRAGIFYRRPLRKRWLYLLVAPEISWKNANNWNREYTVKWGIEMLFWGKKER